MSAARLAGFANPVVWLLLVAFAPAASRGQEQPDLEALREAGRRAAARLESSPASWTSFHAQGAEFLVFEVLQAPPARRRIDIHLERAGQRRHVISILERDGRWLVAEAEGVNGAFRPFEAPFRLPGVYAHLAGALRPTTADQALDTPPGELLGLERGLATWRIDVPEEELRAFDQVMLDAQEAAREKPELAQDPAFRERLRWIGRLEREYLEGELTRIDPETGLVMQRGRPGHRVALAGFRWLEQVDEARLAVGREPPLDASGDPTRGAPEGLLMYSHCSWWRPGLPPEQVVMDARLLELGSRRVRRVPAAGAASTPGCFSRDRARVFVTAEDGLLELDLRTRRSRRLGGAALARGQCLSPAMSPDGRTLAVLHAAPGAPRGQVHLVDVAAGTSRPLGPPLVGAGLAWLPDGERLVLVTREDPGAAERLVVLDRAGGLTPLRAGSAPLPLPDGRLLFLDVEAGLWRTCDALGADARTFHDGLRGLGSPALSPDGARAVFVARLTEGTGLVVVDLATGRREPLDLGPGLFGSPVWR